jgi:hypothetical protein
MGGNTTMPLDLKNWLAIEGDSQPGRVSSGCVFLLLFFLFLFLFYLNGYYYYFESPAI